MTVWFIVFWGLGTLIGLGFAVLMAISVGEAVERRRAWNLWAAGLIDDQELKRRIGE